MLPLGLLLSPWSFHFYAVVMTLDLPQWMSASVEFLEFVSILGVLIGCAGLPFVAIGLFMCRGRKDLEPYAPALLVFAIIVITSIPSHRFAIPLRRPGLERAVERAKPLINALQDFKKDNGKYPEGLRNLIPKYIPSIPTTGMIGAPEYRYQRAASDSRFTGFELSVYCGYASQFDGMYYWSNHDYKDIANGFGGGSFPVGDWTYMRD